MSEIVLPKTKIVAEQKSPRNLIIFSKPKVGKTTLISHLENCLILDFEQGTDFIDAMKIKVGSIMELRQIGDAIKKENYPYQFIAIDTVTALEDMCVSYAEELYSKTLPGKNWFLRDAQGNLHPDSGKRIYGNILSMPKGAGYQYLREAFVKVVEYIKTLAPKIIILGHIKDSQLEKEGSEFTSLDIDLTGKIKRIATSSSDAVGYLYRKGNKNYLTFNTSDTVSCGARPKHLKNKEFVISEIVDDEVVTHWDSIYID